MSVRHVFVGLAILALASACGSGITITRPSSGSPGGTNVSIVAGASSLTTTAYLPDTVTISKGGTVTFVNDDSVSHTVTGSNFNTGAIAPGDRAAITFKNAGTYAFHCKDHPGMTGSVTVQ